MGPYLVFLQNTHTKSSVSLANHLGILKDKKRQKKSTGNFSLRYSCQNGFSGTMTNYCNYHIYKKNTKTIENIQLIEMTEVSIETCLITSNMLSFS